MTPAGFPHSDTHGSVPAFGYPWLFADRCVLLRLPVPRHPPCALLSLTCQKLSLLSLPIMLESLYLGSLASPHLAVQCVDAFVFAFLEKQSLASPASHSFVSSLFSFQSTAALGVSLPLCFSALGCVCLRFVSCFRRRSASGATGGGLKWTRTTDLTLIRRAL